MYFLFGMETEFNGNNESFFNFSEVSLVLFYSFLHFFGEHILPALFNLLGNITGQLHKLVNGRGREKGGKPVI